MSKKFLEQLSKSEKKVHDYIYEKTKETGRMSESMSAIGKAIGVSEATVHRSVRQLRKTGVIGIIPSQEKTESNEIIYYGEPDEEKQVQEIIDLAAQLNSDISRFEQLLNVKDETIKSMEKERELLIKQLKRQQKELLNYKKLIKEFQKIIASYEKGHPVFKKENIIGYTDLDDGNAALIFKKE